MKHFFLIFVLLTQPALACDILCDAVCTQYEAYKPRPQLTLDDEWWKLKSTRIVSAEGNKSYEEVYKELESKCSGKGEFLVVSSAKVSNVRKEPPGLVKPSEVCKRTTLTSSKNPESKPGAK